MDKLERLVADLRERSAAAREHAKQIGTNNPILALHADEVDALLTAIEQPLLVVNPPQLTELQQAKAREQALWDARNACTPGPTP
jgi:hypothetical protein